MKDGGKIAISSIEEDPSYRERSSRWCETTHALLRDSFVRKRGPVRIIAKKKGSRYVVVAGHHLLKAAKECGLREVYVDVVGAGTPHEEYLNRFAEIVGDYCRKNRKVRTPSEARASG